MSEAVGNGVLRSPRQQQEDRGITVHHFNVLEWIGLIVMLFGQLMILVQAFQRSVGWGLAVLFLPGIVSLIFVLVNWKQSGYWFFFALAGFLIVMIF